MHCATILVGQITDMLSSINDQNYRNIRKKSIICKNTHKDAQRRTKTHKDAQRRTDYIRLRIIILKKKMLLIIMKSYKYISISDIQYTFIHYRDRKSVLSTLQNNSLHENLILVLDGN